MDASDKKPAPAMSNFAAWGMNIVSSVAIIMVNKQLMSNSGFAFAFATTLTGFHFLVTAFAGWVSNKAGFSTSRPIPMFDLFWFSIVANFSIVGSNFSLMLNSVGFYQISKLSMIPVVCMMEYVIHSKHYSPRVIMSVAVVAFGVGVCTVTDVKVNTLGLLCACVAVFCTSLQQITIGSFQKKYNVSSMELLSKTAPIQAVSLLILGPFIDYFISGHSLVNYDYSTGAIAFILLSCTLAVFCNLSQYICIGRFSATTFQVLGHMKTVCVLTLGWVLFDSALTLKNLLGMIMAVVGMIIYSWAVEADKMAEQLMGEDVVKLLKDRVSGATESDLELGQRKS